MAYGPPWTPNEDEIIRRMRSTHTNAEIAAALPNKRSADSVSERARQLGLVSKGRSKIVFTEEQIDEMVWMHADHTYVEIAKYFGVSLFTVYRTLSLRGIPNGKNRKKPGYRVRGQKDAYDLAPLELAPGNFAVDAFSFRAITGYEPNYGANEDDSGVIETPGQPAGLCVEDGQREVCRSAEGA